MQSKPIVMEHFSTIHTSYIVDFKFTNNITILTGSSGTGKTTAFSFIKECMSVNPDILCLNYLDYQKNIKDIISTEQGKLIVIDNADILLDDDTRKYISLDDKNQYLIIGRNPKNLFATSENLFELVSKKNGEQTEFNIVSYFCFA
jgi:predicted ATP-binding protein involved in virulence